MVRTPEGYGLYDSTLRQPFNGAYILACADRVLKEKEEKDFKSRFARKAKSDLRAYLDLKAKEGSRTGGALHAALYEDIALEEFLEKLPGPQVEEILEPEKDSPMDTSATAEAAHSPPGETAASRSSGRLSTGRGIRGKGRAYRRLSTGRGIGV